MRHHSLVVFAAGTLLLSADIVAQTQVTIPSSKDNTLFEDPTGSVSNGKGPLCFVGVTFTSMRRHRAVMAFDLTSIPKGAKVTSVDLKLTVAKSFSLSGANVTAHALTADWGEGTSVAGCPFGPGCGGGAGAPATTNDATWVHRFFSTQRWTTPGGDFTAAASGTVQLMGPGQYTMTSTATMVADVQRWVDNPTVNFGWLLQGTGNAWAIETREGPVAGNRPQIVVTYTSTAATVTSTGTGCRGSAATPLVLATNSRPTVPNAAFALALTGGPAGSAVIGLALALFPTGVPLGGGCTLYVNPTPVLVVLGLPPNRVMPAPIPNQASLIGLEAMWQGAVPDANTGQLVTSNALTTKLGT